MSAELLLREFSRIAEAPNATTQLRRYVLEAAVRGKLVPRNPREGDAFHLLKQMEAHRATGLRTNGAVKSSLESSRRVDAPFQIPSWWLWVRLGETLVGHVGGGTPSKSNPDYWGGDIYWASVKDVGRSKELTTTIDRITEAGLANSSSNVVPPGRLIVVTRMGLGKVCINRVPVAINQDLRALAPSPLMDTNFQYIYLKTHDFKGTGLTVKGIRVEELLSVPFPLPPLAEQRRIVAKVNELMALCDQMEGAQTDREIVRDRLRAVSLERLTSSGVNGTDIAADTRLFLEQSPRLITKPEHLPAVRQAIVDLAVCGRLAPQDPADEPAAEVLQRIPVLAGNRRASSRDRAENSPTPFAVPVGWKWTNFGRLISGSDAGWSPKTEAFARAGDAWGVLKVSAVSWDAFRPEENKKLLPGVPPRPSAQVRSGDFLISRANTSDLVAKAVVVSRPPPNLMLSDKIVRLELVADCVPRYLLMINNHAKYARAYYAKEASGASPSMKNVSREVIYSLPIPMPPIGEQHRIVAKVDQLMAVCEELEVALASAQDGRVRLLEAFMHEALASAAVPPFPIGASH